MQWGHAHAESLVNVGQVFQLYWHQPAHLFYLALVQCWHVHAERWVTGVRRTGASASVAPTSPPFLLGTCAVGTCSCWDICVRRTGASASMAPTSPPILLGTCAVLTCSCWEVSHWCTKDRCFGFSGTNQPTRWYRQLGGTCEDFQLFRDQLGHIRNQHKSIKLPSIHVLGDFNFRDIDWPDRLNKSGSAWVSQRNKCW